MAVEFDVFGENWRNMTNSQRYEYTQSYYAWLLLGNKPVVSQSSDGQSITYAVADVEKLLNHLKDQMSSEGGFLGFAQIQPGYHFN